MSQDHTCCKACLYPDKRGSIRHFYVTATLYNVDGSVFTKCYGLAKTHNGRGFNLHDHLAKVAKDVPLSAYAIVDNFIELSPDDAVDFQLSPPKPKKPKLTVIKGDNNGE